MDNFKNAFQVFSPKLYLITIVVGVTVGTCVLYNTFQGVKTEADIWKSNVPAVSAAVVIPPAVAIEGA